MTTTPQNIGQEHAAAQMVQATDVLRKHQLLATNPGKEPFGCSCGWRPSSDRDPVEHQAAMVMVAVGIARWDQP